VDLAEMERNAGFSNMRLGRTIMSKTPGPGLKIVRALVPPPLHPKSHHRHSEAFPAKVERRTAKGPSAVLDGITGCVGRSQELGIYM